MSPLLLQLIAKGVSHFITCKTFPTPLLIFEYFLDPTSNKINRKIINKLTINVRIKPHQLVFISSEIFDRDKNPEIEEYLISILRRLSISFETSRLQESQPPKSLTKFSLSLLSSHCSSRLIISRSLRQYMMPFFNLLISHLRE